MVGMTMKMVIQKSTCRLIPIILAWFLCSYAMIGMPGAVVADNPSDVKLTYDFPTKTLNVSITHKVFDPTIHYINKVNIMSERNVMKTYPTVIIMPMDYVMQTHTYKGQPTLDTFTYSYAVDAVPGDKIVAEIEDKYFGFATSFVTVTPSIGLTYLGGMRETPAPKLLPAETEKVAKEAAPALTPVPVPTVEVAKEAAPALEPLSEQIMAAEKEAAPEATEIRRITLKVQFDFDKADVKPQYYDDIRKLSDILKAHPEMSIVIEGHTCSIGSERYNMTLSHKRAANVRTYLIDKFGIEGSRIKVQGYGESKPIADNTTQEGRRLNRRAEETTEYQVELTQ